MKLSGPPCLDSYDPLFYDPGMFAFLFAALFGHATAAQQIPMPQGSYNRGSLHSAWQLPAAGEGFMCLFPDRRTNWGAQPMIELLERAAIEMSQLFPLRDRLRVGDISKGRGGRIYRHNSHQNGLDVDLGYFRQNGIELGQGRRGFQESMVKKGKITSNFDLQRNWEFMKILHRHGKIVRIFVDRAVKKAFCEYADSLGEKDTYTDVLRSLRPLSNHHNHFHLRLHCPDYALKCKKQSAPLGGSGC